MTDYTCIPFWEETDCDYYVIPHEELKEICIKRGIPEEKLLPFGIPVSRRFRLKNQPGKGQGLSGISGRKKDASAYGRQYGSRRSGKAY